MPPDLQDEVIRSILLDPKDGLSARLLVVENIQTKMEARQEAILLALNGDGQNKGLIELVRELRETEASKMERRQFVWRNLFWQGLFIVVLTLALNALAKHYLGIGV